MHSRQYLWYSALAAAWLLILVPARAQDTVRIAPEPWTLTLKHRLREFGQRNWIVIADSAYPALSKPGVETVVAEGIEQVELTRRVLDALADMQHVRPVIYLDAELPYVSNDDAPGIDAYRENLKRLLGGRKPQALPQDQISDRLDKAAEKFRVLILKTNSRLPYTPVFLELESGYWSPEAEKRLRESMADKK
jgi:hypothetical protein